MIIKGDNIYLKSIESQDTENIINWRNQDFVYKNFIFQEPFTIQIHEKWMKDMVGSGKVKQFIIYLNSVDKPIGSVYLRDINLDLKNAEFGIFIGEENYLGKGYGNEATKLICRYGFDEFNFDHIFLRVLEKNERAINSYLKNGFIMEPRNKDFIKIGGQSQEVVFMYKYNGKVN